MERRRFSQTMASEWQTAFVVSLNVMVWIAHCRQELQQKSLEKLQDFSSRPRPRPRPNVQDQDQDFHFYLRGAPRPRPWSR